MIHVVASTSGLSTEQMFIGIGVTTCEGRFVHVLPLGPWFLPGTTGRPDSTGRQIADALVRTAATRGLHATGMREVAAEAGVSLRLVQYYFGTKEELLLAAMQQLAAQFSDRAMARIRQSRQGDGPASPRDIIAAILTEALPADDERRTFTLVYTAYLALSLTDPALAINPLVRNSNAVSDVIAAQLRTAQAAATCPPAWTRTWKPSA